ncbi:MAG: LPS-assembly protein LptD [Chromatiaceae bacterium]|nr:LPS-assembly protein LptD [Chromatiaceae bacterium]
MVDFRQRARPTALLILLILAPSIQAETRASELADLRPISPAPVATDLAPLEQLAPASPVVLTPAQAEARLHQGLDWTFCGPRRNGSGAPVKTEDASARALPVEILADRVDYDQDQDRVELRGEVEMTQGTQWLGADWASYDRATGQTQARGRVRFEDQGLRLLGEAADYNLESAQGWVESVLYRVWGNANLRGSAARVERLDASRSRFEDLIYTSCPPGRADWSLRARELELDQASGLGVARHARVRIGGVPVFYTPYLRFLIDDRRRSGLLIPSFGSSDSLGTDITVPYYWNIAPNLDATLSPRLMSKRGLMLGAETRYLSASQSLVINGELLPEDREAPEEGLRGALRIEQSGRFGARWGTLVDYAQVSDDTYLVDFGNRLDTTSTRNLSQRADLYYSGQGWMLLGRVQQFQTVDAGIAPANRPYDQLPHIELTLTPQQWRDWLEYRFVAQYDYFDHDVVTHGHRFVAEPAVRLPLRRAYGHLIPGARLHYSAYALQEQTAGRPSDFTHLIPTLDLDGTLVFERETRWLGKPALQTLEPRLYYVYTPEVEQSDAPLFDTTALDFGFSSLFRPNRFTGHDRIGDENRLTLGLTSRTIAERTGRELLRASIGQIHYFDERRVGLDGSASGESDFSSAIAGEFSARILDHWSARASLQWNPHASDDGWERRVLQLHYQTPNERLLNLSYRFNSAGDPSEDYEDTDLSFSLPLGGETRLVGRWLYSLLNEETIEAFAGVEVGRCCWRLRLLGQHLKTSAERDASTSVMLQLELAGLGSLGNRIDSFLERGIHGYHTD